MPELTLLTELTLARDQCPDERRKAQVDVLRQRHMNGDFDATVLESDEWWEREGKAATARYYSNE